jgi:hypothetical protein
MLYQTSLQEGNGILVHTCDRGQSQLFDDEDAGRPFRALLQDFRVSLQIHNQSTITADDNIPLRPDIISYQSLCMKIGDQGIRIQWTDNMTSHLEFDANVRTLTLFRHPAVCLLNCAGASSENLLNM